MNIIYIYGLIDPIKNDIRYIGKSIRPKQRLTNHMNEVSNCHRCNWLQSLKKKGLKPYLIILQELSSDENWQDIEKEWIKKGKLAGWNLTNNTDGGDGVVNLPFETKEKMRLTWLGKKHKPETILKLIECRSKRVTSEETKKKMSNSQKGRKIEWGYKISQSVRKFSKNEIDEILHRLNNGELGVNLAKEFNVHRTTITKIKMGKYPK